MDSLIQIVNELQEVFSVTGSNAIELPQIVVVGAQSSGKSSVLESLVGKSFLPRGASRVTRCPAVLRLIYTPHEGNWSSNSSCSSSYTSACGSDVDNCDEDDDEDPKEWCEFQHLPEEKFTDFEKVRQEIEDETDRKAGTNMNIVNDPIYITVYSPNVVNLTVVDLPGIVKVPAGDQPKDIERQVTGLILYYIRNPNSIILAVSAANNDIHTSESLKFAKYADRGGDRTLAIITKLDLMDKGTDAFHLLSGEVIKVKLGIIGVVNRSQQDINENRTIEDSLAAEKAFLEERYPTLASTNGTPYLAHKLNGMLMEHIGKCLPDLELRIESLLERYNAKVDALGGLPTDKSATMIQLINKFCESFKATIVGGDNMKLERKSLCGGAKIREICQTRVDELLNGLDNCPIPDEEIQNTIKNSTGYEATMHPLAAFQSLVKEQIKGMKKPLLSCATKAHNELKSIAQMCITEDIRRYPKFHHALLAIINDMWNKAFKELKDDLEKYIKIEASHVNTDHEDFKRESEAWLKEQCKHSKEIGHYLPIEAVSQLSFAYQVTDSCRIAKCLIKIYFRIVLKGIKDHFRKSLAYHMIYYAMENLSSELMTKMYHPDQVADLIQEAEETMKARAEAQTMIKALERATEIIEKTRTIVSS